MNGAVGGDDYGAQLKTRLRENHVDTTGVLTEPDEKSGTCIVLVNNDSGESRNVGQQGANLKYTPREPFRIEHLVGKTKERPDLVITHLGILVDVAKKVLETAKNSGVDTILNPSPTSFLTDATYENVTHLIFNEQEAAEMANKTIEDFNEDPPCDCVGLRQERCQIRDLDSRQSRCLLRDLRRRSWACAG